MADDMVLAPSALANIRKVGGDALLTQMIDLFITAAPRRLEAMHSAAAAGDLDALARAAHSLKSSAGNFGALEMHALTGEIEDLAWRGQAEGLPPLVARIDDLYARLKAALENERKE